MINIVCTGSPSHGGIASSLEKYYPNTYFVSKSNNYDLLTESDYMKFIDIVKNYNVFINHAQINLGFQEKILTDVYKNWSKHKIKGHIISIGSIVELEEWSWLDPVTSNEKISIRNVSLALNCENIKTTHLITSGFNRYGPEEDVKINPDKIVETIRFILESDIDIPLIYVEHTNNIRLKKWRNLK